MAVQRRVNWISQQRVDLPDMRSLESAASNDFDQLIQAFVTGTTQGYIVRGFNILMADAIGAASNGLQMQVDPGAILHILASQSGTILMVPPGTAAQPLNAAINTNVTGAFFPSAFNYVSIDYVRFIDPSTSAQVYLWDPTSNDETTINAPRAQILEYVINISTTIPTGNLLPIAIVETDAGNNVVQVSDARWLLGRLGRGGVTPNPFYTYPWPQGRNENPSTSTSDSIDPFSGGDKAIDNLKSWMDAVMSSILEIKGTTYWYSSSDAGSLESLREDAINTVITGRGSIAHGILPNTTPILITTGNIVSGSNQLTSLASTVGLVNGLVVQGVGIPYSTTILNISGSTVTLSSDATATVNGVAVTFQNPTVITAAGQINWDQNINIRVLGSALTYSILANPTSTDITLSDGQVAYITLVRGVLIAPNLVFTNGIPQVASVGAIAWTASLQPGDYIKLASDTDSGYYEILTVDSLTQVTLTSNFTGTSTGAGGTQAEYAFGSYEAVATPTTSRHIFITNSALMPAGSNVFWLFLRTDNGGAQPRVYIRFLGSELSQGESQNISNTTPEQLLQYIGAPTDASSAPQYVQAVSPGAIPEIQTLTLGSAATIAQNSYFFINSSSNIREYYVWFNKDGGGTDPMPNNVTGVIMVPISTGQTNIQVAAAVTVALNSTFYSDFLAVQVSSPNNFEVQVTNTSAGACESAANFNVGAPFAVVVNQVGTGIGNNFIKDGDSLTLAIKELDMELGNVLSALDSPDYDEPVDIVASGATPPTSLNGPIAPATQITLPNNSRIGGTPAQYYTVGKGFLQVYLNGVFLRLGEDWTEFGAGGTPSQTIVIQQVLDIGDSLEFRIDHGSSVGAGGGGPPGPPGPPGPTGPAGSTNVNISTKNTNYTVLSTDNVLLANATGGAITFSLPSAATVTGRIFYFKKIDSTGNAMILLANGSDLIDGFSTQMTSVQYESFTIVSDGTNWWII